MHTTIRILCKMEQPVNRKANISSPNEWVIDAVNVGASNEWQWNVTSTGLDMGHTYIGMNNTVAENIGKCVMRKAAYKDGDREVLQDTNNSTVDFTPATTPSLFNK